MYTTDALQHAIESRQKELHRIADILGRKGAQEGSLASLAKGITIVLGAFVATNAVAKGLFPKFDLYITIVYTVAGLTIAAASGLEAAFKIDGKSNQLKQLAARCQTKIYEFDTAWRKNVEPESGEARRKAAGELLDNQDKFLGEVQAKAAEQSVNITLQIRALYGDEVPATA